MICIEEFSVVSACKSALFSLKECDKTDIHEDIVIYANVKMNNKGVI